jgi:hypothetical protein
VIIDELPTIYFRGLDNLIATARSNKIAVCLGFQDFSQLNRDYDDKESKVAQNTVGNIFSGQVVAELSLRFGFSGGQIENIARKCTIDSIISGNEPDFDALLFHCENEMLTNDRKMIGFCIKKHD